MPNFSMDHDAEFWQAPRQLEPLRAFGPEIGCKVSYFAMGDTGHADTPIAMVFKMDPGYVVGRHAHPCERFEVVVRGSIESDGSILTPGDVMTARPNEFYGPKTAGPDGCTTIEFFAKAAGAYTRMVEGQNGEAISSNLLEVDLSETLGQNGVPVDQRLPR